MDDGPFGGVRYDGSEPEAGWGPPPILREPPRKIETSPGGVDPKVSVDKYGRARPAPGYEDWFSNPREGLPLRGEDDFPTFLVWFLPALSFVVGLFIGLFI